MWLFSQCFKISDGRISKFWEVTEDTDVYSYNERTIRFGFREMILDQYFYSKILEGEEKEVRIFSTIKKAMDTEFDWPS